MRMVTSLKYNEIYVAGLSKHLVVIGGIRMRNFFPLYIMVLIAIKGLRICSQLNCEVVCSFTEVNFWWKVVSFFFFLSKWKYNNNENRRQNIFLFFVLLCPTLSFYHYVLYYYIHMPLCPVSFRSVSFCPWLPLENRLSPTYSRSPLYIHTHTPFSVAESHTGSLLILTIFFFHSNILNTVSLVNPLILKKKNILGSRHHWFKILLRMAFWKTNPEFRLNTNYWATCPATLLGDALLNDDFHRTPYEEDPLVSCSEGPHRFQKKKKKCQGMNTL